MPGSGSLTLAVRMPPRNSVNVVCSVPGALGAFVGAPLWAVGETLAAEVESLPGQAPYELATAFQRAIDAGERVAAIEIGPTRDLTAPGDLLLENFPYLSSL